MKETVLGLNKKLKYYLYQGSVNMGKGIDALSGLIRNDLMRDPLSDEVFIFLSSNRKLIKILRWKDTAFVLYTVKLYNGRYFRPEFDNVSKTYNMDWESFLKLITTYQETRSRSINIDF